MRWLFAAVLAGCSFRPTASTGAGDAGRDVANARDTATPDAPPDAISACPTDDHLRLCFSFDRPPLPAMLPDEGAAAVDAQLTNVGWVADATGGAALLDTTSEIYVPYTADVANILSLEVWFRIDTDAADGGRSGLVDSNVVPPNISLFVYRTDPTHQLRCGIGSQTEVWDIGSAPLTGAWHYAACVCDGGALTMYLDGALIGAIPGNCSTAGAFVADGFTIGSNNNGGPSGVNDWLIGGISAVRLWDESLSGATVCQTAGRTGC